MKLNFAKWKKFIQKIEENESEYLIENDLEKELDLAAIDLRLLFNSYVKAGFSEKQAMELLTIQIFKRDM